MTTSMELIGIILDNILIVEVLVIGVIIAVIGGLGYMFFVSSMRDDDADKLGEDLYNPWDELNKSNDSSNNNNKKR